MLPAPSRYDSCIVNGQTLRYTAAHLTPRARVLPGLLDAWVMISGAKTPGASGSGGGLGNVRFELSVQAEESAGKGLLHKKRLSPITYHGSLFCGVLS